MLSMKSEIYTAKVCELNRYIPMMRNDDVTLLYSHTVPCIPPWPPTQVGPAGVAPARLASARAVTSFYQIAGRP